MAKTVGSLFSMVARGGLGQTICFNASPGKQSCKRWNYPRKTTSLAQHNQRFLVGLCNAYWKGLDAPTKATWDSLAQSSNESISGYNFFLRSALADPANVIKLKYGFLPASKANDSLVNLSNTVSSTSFLSGADGEPITSVPGPSAKISGAFANSANGSRIRVTGLHESWNGSSFSVSCWCSCVLPSSGFLLNFVVSSSPLVGFCLRFNTDDNPLKLASYVDRALINSAFQLNVKSGSWFHITASFNGTDWLCWINGIRVSPGTTSVDLGSTNLSLLIFGINSRDYRLNGALAGLAMYNRAINDSEAVAIYDVMRLDQTRRQYVLKT